jgi:hypothetical protein
LTHNDEYSALPYRINHYVFLPRCAGHNSQGKSAEGIQVNYLDEIVNL